MEALKADHAGLVSSHRKWWNAFYPKSFQIESLAGAPCRVRTGLREPIVASGNRPFKVEIGKDHNGLPLTTVDLCKGETVLLMSRNDQPGQGEFTIEPVAAQPERLNFYGSAKNTP